MGQQEAVQALLCMQASMPAAGSTPGDGIEERQAGW